MWLAGWRGSLRSKEPKCSLLAAPEGAALDPFAGLEECMFMSWHGLSLSSISLLEGPLAPQGRGGFSA